MINIEMIGRPSEEQVNKAWVTGRSLSNIEEVLAPSLRRQGVELITYPMGERLFRASDNYPLALKGVVAHSISAGSLHKDYHQPSDDFAKINLTHMATIISAIRLAALDLSMVDVLPSYNALGESRLDAWRARQNKRRK